MLQALTLAHCSKEYLVPSGRQGLPNHFLNRTGSSGALAGALVALA
jgi:hypothetical protein